MVSMPAAAGMSNDIKYSQFGVAAVVPVVVFVRAWACRDAGHSGWGRAFGRTRLGRITCFTSYPLFSSEL